MNNSIEEHLTGIEDQWNTTLINALHGNTLDPDRLPLHWRLMVGSPFFGIMSWRWDTKRNNWLADEI